MKSQMGVRLIQVKTNRDASPLEREAIQPFDGLPATAHQGSVDLSRLRQSSHIRLEAKRRALEALETSAARKPVARYDRFGPRFRPSRGEAELGDFRGTYVTIHVTIGDC